MQYRYILFAFLIFFSLISSGDAYQPTEEVQICLNCHNDKSLSTTFKSGERLSLFVDDHSLRDSVHSELSCSNCHSDFSVETHPQRAFKTARSYKVSASKLCTNCHAPNKGIHAKMLNAVKVLVCTDCHGAHSVKKPTKENSCISCHRFSLSMTFADGKSISIHIDEADIQKSVHSKLRCYDCHFGFSAEEHPERKFKTRRNITLLNSEGCRRCHFDKYTKTLESIHYDILSQGNLNAPVCVDCHGGHSIFSGRKEKLLNARRCERCHSKIYEAYSQSVHGSALVSEHNQDVPVCSDCHRAHDIIDPRTVDFRNMTPGMCGNCHANEELMSKYGLSTAVLKSYLEDFHGVTVTFYRKQKNAVRHIAVCTDCHGIHDITKTKGSDSAVLKSKLLSRCQKCHPNAAENFPDAWLSHYEPTFKRAPLVYAINLIYKIFIPFMLIGLILQILLHIWRYAVNR
ncbi:MAG: cytochrome c3 family protein [Nitrospirae bacterium]|nr:cytochrome c3 family protein [Nitrospirota bacterium]